MKDCGVGVRPAQQANDEQLSRRNLLCLAGALAAGVLGPAGVGADQPSIRDAEWDIGQVARGNRFAVATVHSLATEAGLKMLAAGGNAADAAVAAGLMLGVVDGYNSGLGGGCFVLARKANGEVLAIDGRETAPGLATPDMFIKDGRPVPSLSQTGPLAVGVPGAVAAYYRLSQEMGTGRWKSAVKLAAERASDGFEISNAFATRIRDEAETMVQFEGTRQIFFDQAGKPLGAGARLIQQDLAKTLSELGDGGDRAFYEGRFAELVESWMVLNDGLLRREDFKSYRTRSRTPIETDFHQYKILGFPPPSSGGVHVAQILGMLDQFNLQDLASNRPAAYYHLLAEAMRLAFADRAAFLGDPTFADVPVGLIDKEYLRKRASLLDLERKIPIVSAGAPPKIGQDLFGRLPRHTTHFSAVDAIGNWVAITSTINTTFGSKVVVPGTGVLLNNQMDDFAIAPGIPNAFGLIGNEVNSPAPGKRPLSSMSPTIVLKDDKPVLTCGAAGGPRIITATTQILLNYLALDYSVEDAVAATRIHHQWKPDTLYVEAKLDPTIIKSLEKLGHTIQVQNTLATAQAIARGDTGELTAVGETRISGAAGAY